MEMNPHLEFGTNIVVLKGQLPRSLRLPSEEESRTRSFNMHGTFHLEFPINFINAPISIFLQTEPTLTSSASSWNSLWSEIFHILKLSVRFDNKSESRPEARDLEWMPAWTPG